MVLCTFFLNSFFGFLVFLVRSYQSISTFSGRLGLIFDMIVRWFHIRWVWRITFFHQSRFRRVIVKNERLLARACAIRFRDSTLDTLPKPGIVIDQLDGFSSKKLVPDFGDVGIVNWPGTKVHKNPTELRVLSRVLARFNKINSFNRAWTDKFFEDILNISPINIGECAWNAD